MNWATSNKLLLLAIVTCTFRCHHGADADTDEVAADEGAITKVATQNAGTTSFLDLVASEPPLEVRQNCTEYYSNNLCLVESEQILLSAIETDQPDVVFLQEMFNQEECADVTRPAEVNEAPYACGAGDSPQIERVLPDGYSYGCATGYPDNCIAFRDNLFELTAPDGVSASCDGIDCSTFMVSNPAECSVDGRIAYLQGESEGVPFVLVVVHANAGVNPEDAECRRAQLESIEAVLLEKSSDTPLVIAGDFNLDPNLYATEDAVAFIDMLDSLKLTWLPVDGNTHLISQIKLDHVLTRGLLGLGGADCSVRFLDEGEDHVLFDHAFVLCE